MGNLFSKAVGKAIKLFNTLAQSEAVRSDGEYSVNESAQKAYRQLAAEGIVMLKNNSSVLPLCGKSVAVFGRCQIDWFYCGYGSGGDVNVPYRVNLLNALENSAEISLNTEVAEFYKKQCEKNKPDEGFWGHWPYCFEEFVPDDSLVKSAAATSDVAVAVIGRAAGEDRENKLEKGSYYLADDEKKLLNKLTENFEKVVLVLDCGNIIDFGEILSYGDKISALLLAFQGGMESGNALADVLTGRVNPCGKLTDTVAFEYEDYPSSADFGGKKFNNYTEDIFVGYRYFETFAPEKVAFPFGFGLSYTDFKIEPKLFGVNDDSVSIKAAVKNIGSVCGKQVVQVYCEPPVGKISTPKRVLCAFAKTKTLAPGEECEVCFDVPLYLVSSFDESGISGFETSYILQKGRYKFYISDCVRNGALAGVYTCGKTCCIEKLSHICPIKEQFVRLKRDENGEIAYEVTPDVKGSLAEKIIRNLPKNLPVSQDRGYKLADVKSGKVSMNDFAAQFSLAELEALTRGDFVMNSSLGAKGNAGVFGGVLPSLRAKGVPALTATDGPAGIRLKAKCSLLPTGACMAASWNAPLIEEAYAFVGEEMAAVGSDVLLAPGMNIHRNPLCGRNFEYFSEDPVVSGLCAAAVVRGVQSKGKSACPKHFACNNQEVGRVINDSRVSERALREIYLKGFELAVKTSKPKCIMTSYNKINSVYSYNNYDLATTVLRGEWGYGGTVITDWWVRPSRSPDFPMLRDNAYRVRAQVDVLMPGVGARSRNLKKPDNSLLESMGKHDGITAGEIQRSAKNVLKLCLDFIE